MFQCFIYFKRIVINFYFHEATGKGDSKKKSKMNAAENLLNQLENLESS